jgi:TldD protein
MKNLFVCSKILKDLNVNFLIKNLYPLFQDTICGDLFLENEITHNIIMENGKVIKNIKNYLKGFSVRIYKNHITYMLSSTDVTLDNIGLYINKLLKILNILPNEIQLNNVPLISTKNFQKFYKKEIDDNDAKKLLKEIHTYINNKGYVSNLILSINYENNHREIYNEKLEVVEKITNHWSLRFNLTLQKDKTYETFYRSISNQDSIDFLKDNWKKIADELWADAYELLKATFLTAGTYTILCAPGDAGTIIHEAVGHALESDLLFTNNSCFSNKQGEKIANDIVTVIDDGTIENARGTIDYDDEGNEAKKNILIKDGIFVGELNNKIYAYKSKNKFSGNGRRQHFDDDVIPRMTNTYLAAGTSKFEDMLAKIDKGVYVKFIGGGQVDTATGSFVFEGKISYMIENGKITHPLKEVMLMGNCKDILHNIIEISENMLLCHSGGYCGKDGQNVPVTVGGPFFTIKNVTIGGK